MLKNLFSHLICTTIDMDSNASLDPLCCYSKQLGVVSLLGVAVLLQDWPDAIGEGGSDPVATRVAILFYQHNIIRIKPG